MNRIHRSALALAAVMTLGAFAVQASAAGQQPVKTSAADEQAAEKKQGPSGATATAPAPKYHVVRHIPLGGEGGWDYLTMDSASRRLFISRGTHVMVVDVDRGVLAGDIPKTDGVHGIALAPEMNRGFISNGRTSTMTIFDLKTLAVIQEVKTTGDRPDAILYDPFSKRVFTFNAGGKNATAFDAATGAVAGTIDLGGKPEFAASDLKGRIFVNIEDKSEISAINSSTLKVTDHWPLAPCEEPSGLAIDRAHKVLFSGCSNKTMAIVDARNGHLITTVPIGAGVDACAWDPALGLAFSSNGADGTLTVVRQSAPQSYAVADNAATQKGARTMALDESTHHIFLSTAQFGPPPAPTADRPHPRPTVLPGTFEIVEVAP
jgi:hypothetical protein